MESHLLATNAGKRYITMPALKLPQYRAPQNVAAFFTGQDTDVLRLTHYRTIPRSDDFRDSSNGVISGVSAAISSNRSIAISSVRP